LAETQTAIVGAGIVGLAVAYQLACTAPNGIAIIDRDLYGDRASNGNAGGIAVTEVVPASSPDVCLRVLGWLVDPLGPLSIRPSYAPRLLPWMTRFARHGTTREMVRISQALAELNSRTYDDLKPLLATVGLLDALHEKGALAVYESEAGYRRDRAAWNCRRRRSIVVQELDGNEARKMEPALGPRVCRAIFLPQWSWLSDPSRVLDRLRDWLARRGVRFIQAMVHRVEATHDGAHLKLESGEVIDAKSIVIAAGAWSGKFARQLNDPVLLESERGYNCTLPTPGIALSHQLIFAERQFVATPLSCGLRIGGAAEFGGLNAAPNFKRSQRLVELARRYLPDLRAYGGKHWAGHRPATPDSLPVIGRSEVHPNIFYAFGHGHLGLTQAATTGRLIADLLLNRVSPIDLRPFSISRFS